MAKHHDENWSLFRLSDRKQFDNVSLATIDFFFRALSHKSHADWLMWREGFSGWRPFSELPLILKHLQKDSAPHATPPPVPEAILKYSDETTGVRKSVPVDVDSTEDHATQAVHAVEETDETDETASQDFNEVSRFSQTPRSTTKTSTDDERHQQTHSVSVRAIHAATAGLRQRNTAVKSAPPPEDLSYDVEAPKAPTADRSARADLADHARVIPMTDEATLSLMLESQAANEDRNNVRYQKRFKVRIFTPKGVVNTVTTDCSTSGFRLKEPLPQGLARFFHVELDLGPEGKIPLVCSEIREKDGRAATRVRIQVNDYLAILKSALVRAA